VAQTDVDHPPAIEDEEAAPGKMTEEGDAAGIRTFSIKYSDFEVL